MATPKGLPQPPSGGREVSTRYNFLNFTKKGENIDGTLVGTVKIKNQRGEERERYVIQVADQTFVLPDHINLQRALDDIATKYDGVMGVRVWVQFLAKEKVEGVANEIAMYRVVEYGRTGKK